MSHTRPWSWVPTLYFAQGLPYVVVVTVSTLMYKDLGLSNTELALYTSGLYLPWVLKPLWSPVVDGFGRKRAWTVGMQAVGAAGLALLGIALPTSAFLVASLAALWVMAFASATHDVAADGFYMLALPEAQQAAWAGVRGTAYRIAMILGEGQLVVFAGWLGARLGSSAGGWSGAMLAASAVFFVVAAFHALVLPRPDADVPTAQGHGLLTEFRDAFVTFFAKPDIGRILAFLLLYRFAEAQLVKMIGPFLLEDRATGGLGLTTTDVGFAKGTVGVAFLVAGGILGGIAVSRGGLKRWLWPMVAILHLPDVVFLLFAWLQPASLWTITAGIAVEQFGYGFGFTAYMLYMILISDGPRKTTHYALGTGIMALGMMVPGGFSGWLADHLGWRWFFAWVAVATIPGWIAAALVDIPEDFGRKRT
ncbi:MAG: MFS transporter [Alphaproteobacteria bacterium]|nr:MFS transporter [Alphaproteobacteria bacterium]MCB9697681.1 MFS transporter [Alphaproteobacteria bacterium]